MHDHRTLVLGFMAAAAVAAPAHAGGGAVYADNFNDGVAAPGWLEFETHPLRLTVAEANLRLELSASQNIGINAIAGYLSTGWVLSLESDFFLSVEWAFSVGPAPGGEAGLVIGLFAGGSLETGEPEDGVSMQIGIEGSDPYWGHEVFVDGDLVENGFGPRNPTSGTIYFWYEAGTDTLFVSVDRAADPTVVDDFQATTGACQVGVLLAGFTDGSAPAFGGASAHFDDLVIESGTIDDPCPADLDCDGQVGITDLLALLAAWGQSHVPPDIDGDGVGITDLLALLGDWGRCP